ncbi:MAG TPA: putative phage tail protein [Pseudoneobacillus sp.]|nr:putative phage tail protein [Pseudoneobacillus sp.]
MKPIGSDIDRVIRTSLMTYIPSYYQDSMVVDELLRVDSDELESLNSNVTDVINQFFVDTATWGLDTWEKICGIEIAPTGMTYEQRRSKIKGKLRGVGVVNATLIKNVAESFQNGEVSVEEKFNNYEVVITFIGSRGVPDDLDGIKKAVNDIIPAHLKTTFVLTYLSWSELEIKALTFNTEDTYTWNGLETAFL